ncbi:spore coat protein U domain-containing protein [Ditylenchus destructor]|uniref:Spore coat protein U domain-containing protein n=1 Tax=Ditylenchus destructor TaxID=166010 RepID=A0AAD4MG62_9BILA|nr:spore coat protein U domain-containing protein [Ditylenchus destructor]
MSLSRPISGRVTAYVSAYSDLDRSNSFGAFAMLNIRIGRSTMLTASAERDGGRTAFETQLEGLAGQRQGDVGWGLSNRVILDGEDTRRAYVSYRAPEALVRARIVQSGEDWLASLEMEGSVVAAGGGVFLANRIGDGFVIVKNAGPGTEVLQGGVRMGKTNDAGRVLLPDVVPYYPQQIFLDPATMADGWEAGATERIAVSGYRQGAVVDFSTRRVSSALVVLHDGAGRPIEAGYVAAVEGGETAVIGYDGEVYLRGLGPVNRVTHSAAPADRHLVGLRPWHTGAVRVPPGIAAAADGNIGTGGLHQQLGRVAEPDLYLHRRQSRQRGADRLPVRDHVQRTARRSECLCRGDLYAQRRQWIEQRHHAPRCRHSRAQRNHYRYGQCGRDYGPYGALLALGPSSTSTTITSIVPAGGASGKMAGTYTNSFTIYQAKTATTLLGLCGLFGALTGAQAFGNYTANFVVPKMCTLNATPAINFNNVTSIGPTAARIDAQGTVTVECNTPYTIYIGDGQNRVAPGSGNRQMAQGTARLPYQLFKDAARTQVWDATGGTAVIGGSGGVSDPGTGAPQSKTVYASIPAGTTLPVPGTYTDTVVITVTY